ncbi:hypothetical protein HYX06_03920 [Candidatus Woesearchaeota archaeon]|nr:hypothetical protein [Candidatus Woesearchaeota archaeon]
MEIESSVIETGVDKLVNIIKERGRIALADAAKELGVSTTVVQEWVDFLEDEGIISVEYKMTKPFLVERKLTKKEVEAKSKEFESKKDVFVRKAEFSLSFLDKQAEDLKNVKGEFDRIKNELGLELDTVRNELKELERYQQMKQELQKQVEEQKNDAKAKIEALTKQILNEQRRYQELVAGIEKEKNALTQEKQQAKSIEESEKLLNKRLEGLKGTISLIENRIGKEDAAIRNSESHIERLNSVIEDVRQRVEEEKSSIVPLMEKSNELEKKMAYLQENIIKKITEKRKTVTNADQITKKVNDFFAKKMTVVNLVDRVNRDRDELEKSLIELIKKAKSFQIAGKKDSGREMLDIEKKFDEVNEKKGVFESELKKMTSFFGK